MIQLQIEDILEINKGTNIFSNVIYDTALTSRHYRNK